MLVEIAGYVGGAAWMAVKETFRILGSGVVMAIKVIKKLADLFVNLVNGDFIGAANNLKSILGAVGEHIENVFDSALSIVTGTIGARGRHRQREGVPWVRERRGKGHV